MYNTHLSALLFLLCNTSTAMRTATRAMTARAKMMDIDREAMASSLARAATFSSLSLLQLIVMSIEEVGVEVEVEYSKS